MEAETELCPFCAAEWPVEFCLERPGMGCRTDDDPELDSDTEQAPETVTGAQEAPEPESEQERVYKDARSTGRKRAAKLYGDLVNNGSPCEWAWSKNCGGGVYPIVGCTGRPATHIHHGPDKSTFNNERSNISLVCEYCHNRWHALNDPTYPEGRPDQGETWLPSVPDEQTIYSLEDILPATREEIFANELSFPVRGKDKDKIG